MGSCGCSNWGDILKILEVENTLVFVNLYHGCSYCKTAPAVDVITYDKQEFIDLYGQDIYETEFEPLVEERFDDNYTEPISVRSLLRSLPPIVEWEKGA